MKRAAHAVVCFLRAVGAVVLWFGAFCFAGCSAVLAYLGQRAWPWQPALGPFTMAEVLSLLADGAQRKAAEAKRSASAAHISAELQTQLRNNTEGIAYRIRDAIKH